MNYLYLLLLAIAPGIALVAFILLHDRYDKEPRGLLIKIFFLGMVAILPTIIVELIGQSFNVFSGTIGLLIEMFIIIGLTEEFFKRAVVKRYAFSHPAFNERLDGIVYCCMAALGFATLENVFYIFSFYASQPDIWILRAFLSVPIHMLLGITMGYYLSLSKFCTDPQKSASYFKMSLFIPAILHGAFNFIISTQLPLLSLLLIPFVIYFWITAMIKLRRYYKESKQQFVG